VDVGRLWGTLAVTVVAFHLAFIVFVVFGGLLLARWRRAPWIHLPAAVWGTVVELTGGVCPLTPLENRLREAAGSAAYPGSFIEHYLLDLVYPSGLTPKIQLGLGIAVVLVNVATYAWAWRRRGRADSP
jgi:hypothetical protein